MCSHKTYLLMEIALIWACILYILSRIAVADIIPRASPPCSSITDICIVVAFMYILRICFNICAYVLTFTAITVIRKMKGRWQPIKDRRADGAWWRTWKSRAAARAVRWVSPWAMRGWLEVMGRLRPEVSTGSIIPQSTLVLHWSSTCRQWRVRYLRWACSAFKRYPSDQLYRLCSGYKKYWYHKSAFVLFARSR